MNTNSSSPMVYICVPAYNASKTISITLDSILAQSYRNIKVFVADNASDDNTVEIVEQYVRADSRVKIFRHSSNIGAEANFSYCIKIAEGDYTAIYHADDVYSPDMIAEEVAALETNKSAGAVFTMAEGSDAQGRIIKKYRLPPNLLPGPDELYHFNNVFKAILKYGNFLFCPSAMVRTAVYKTTVKIWDEKNYKTSADLDVWLRILKDFPVVIINKPLFHYKLTADSYSYKLARVRTVPSDMFLVLDDHVKKSPQGLLSAVDFKNYELLKLRDNIRIAVNMLLADRKKESRLLLKRLFDLNLLLHAIKSCYHIRLIFYGYGVLFMSLMPLTDYLKKKIFDLRFGT